MDTTTVIDALIGVLMPLPIALISQSHWPSKIKGLLALAVCFAAAAGVEVWRGGITWSDWRGTALVLTGAALVSYQVWWRPSTIGPAVEAATTLSQPAQRGP